MSEEEGTRLYLLARYFQINEYEARHVRPAWYCDLLLEKLYEAESEAPEADPEDRVTLSG